MDQVATTIDPVTPDCEIAVEFFGIPRQRAGIASVRLRFEFATVSLSDVLRRLAIDVPDFASECLQHGMLRPQYAANVDGMRFVTAAETPLSSGQTLLIMSADAGG